MVKIIDKSESQIQSSQRINGSIPVLSWVKSPRRRPTAADSEQGPSERSGSPQSPLSLPQYSFIYPHYSQTAGEKREGGQGGEHSRVRLGVGLRQIKVMVGLSTYGANSTWGTGNIRRKGKRSLCDGGVFTYGGREKKK